MSAKEQGCENVGIVAEHHLHVHGALELGPLGLHDREVEGQEVVEELQFGVTGISSLMRRATLPAMSEARQRTLPLARAPPVGGLKSWASFWRTSSRRRR